MSERNSNTTIPERLRRRWVVIAVILAVVIASAYLVLRVVPGVTSAAPPAAKAMETTVTPAPSPTVARTPVAHNVIMITLGTLRTDRLSCYGSHLAAPPNIDAFAAQGVRFKNATSSRR